jgi:hypothetical protein
MKKDQEEQLAPLLPQKTSELLSEPDTKTNAEVNYFNDFGCSRLLQR